jgi:hypothetical protein
LIESVDEVFEIAREVGKQNEPEKEAVYALG